MTIEQLAAKKFAGCMSHPVCEITGCRNDDLHDIILTEDGGVYLICQDHIRQYREIMQRENILRYKGFRERGIPDSVLSRADFDESRYQEHIPK